MMIEVFKKFLEDNDLTQRFIDNGGSFDNLKHIESKPDYYLGSSFVFKSSNEGFYYWVSIENMWLKEIFKYQRGYDQESVL